MKNGKTFNNFIYFHDTLLFRVYLCHMQTNDLYYFHTKGIFKLTMIVQFYSLMTFEPR